jgi:hypothetical protein
MHNLASLAPAEVKGHGLGLKSWGETGGGVDYVPMLGMRSIACALGVHS